MSVHTRLGRILSASIEVGMNGIDHHTLEPIPGCDVLVTDIPPIAEIVLILFGGRGSYWILLVVYTNLEHHYLERFLVRLDRRL